MYKRKILSLRRVITLLFALILFSQILSAMMLFLSNDKLVNSAAFIVVAVTKNVRKTGESIRFEDEDISVMRNELKVVKSLKGSMRVGDSFSMNTLKFYGRMEDSVELPPKGSKVLLFFKSNEKGELVPVNGIQGVWRIYSDGKLQYGTMDEIEELIRKEKEGCESTEFNSLVDRAEMQTQTGHYKDALDSYRKAYPICPMKDLEEQMAWLMGEAGYEEKIKKEGAKNVK